MKPGNAKITAEKKGWDYEARPSGEDRRTRIFSKSSDAAWPGSSVENSFPSSTTGAVAQAARKLCCVPGDAVRFGPRMIKLGRVARIRINESCRWLLVRTLYPTLRNNSRK